MSEKLSSPLTLPLDATQGVPTHISGLSPLIEDPDLGYAVQPTRPLVSIVIVESVGIGVYAKLNDTLLVYYRPAQFFCFLYAIGSKV